MSIFNSELEAADALMRLVPGGAVLDFAYSNGAVRSSKEVLRINAEEWEVFHLIDGSSTRFDLEDMIDVLLCRRSAWDGTPGLND